MVEHQPSREQRKRRGAWYTPPDLVDTIVDAVVTDELLGRSPVLSVLDPACGDGRFLAAVARRAARDGRTVRLTGVDVDPSAVAAARFSLADVPAASSLVCDDALSHAWGAERFDLVIGNPPFLSQLAAATTRGGASVRGGGPYADAAVEFLALGAELVAADGGRVAMVLPQSVLASRDAAPVREAIDARASLVWSWWSHELVFDAQVHTCVVAFEFGRTRGSAPAASWTSVVTAPRGIPDLPVVAADGTLGDRAVLNANFRDQYYGMIPGVADHESGPPLITSGLIDPGRSLWGSRPVRIAGSRYERPRLDVDVLDDDMRRWARRRLVPKVLVANQTRVIEAVVDPAGEWLPAVPVVAAYPRGVHWDTVGGDPAGAAQVAREIAAVLTSPYASCWLWHRSAGTGLSADSVRASPAVLADLPWPGGRLEPAVAALERGDVRGCGHAVDAAYGIDDDTALAAWWGAAVDRLERRQASLPVP